jgi:hypothetical protein
MINAEKGQIFRPIDNIKQETKNNSFYKKIEDKSQNNDKNKG